MADDPEAHPEEYFYFLNEHVVARLVHESGRLVSPGLLPSTPDWLEVLEGRTVLLSPWVIQALHVAERRRVEIAAERERQRTAPTAPSRAACLFLFSDRRSVELAADTSRWPLDEVRVFRPERVVRSLRVDMSWVTMANTASDEGLAPLNESEFWERYWGGEPHPPSILADCEDPACEKPPVRITQPAEEPIWEWLVEGSLVLDRDRSF